ncbi:hypothetical protein ACIQPR_18860 [Streptomyces sp. NPDC091280]|uniref:hypothetical protein n=1 Tax=Streptomyces sp. NPDC091280 TaxID=3365984 RepID=UPI00380A21F4
MNTISQLRASIKPRMGTHGCPVGPTTEFSGSLSSWECSGIFISNDGRIEDPRAEADLSSGSKGHSGRLERTGLGSYQEVGSMATAKAFALILFDPMPIVVIGGFELRKRRRSARHQS